MAKKKRDEDDAERRAHQEQIDRYNAMRKRVAAKPRRTLGDLFTLRLAILADLRAATAVRDEVLDRVYGGLKGPPDTGKWDPNPKHRTLFCHVDGRERLKAVRFGWSFREPYRENRGRGWVMSWCDDWYDGYGDPRLLRDLCGREPKGAIDQLVCAGELHAALQTNDEALALEFHAAYHRENQLWQRKAAVHNEIVHSITTLLEKRHDWRAEKGETWRRLTFEDGTVVTVTNEGEVVFGDAIVDHRFSFLDEATKRNVYPSLAERQQRAQERQWQRK